jgi:hypothetical protein
MMRCLGRRENHALDYIRDIARALAAWPGKRYYAWWVRPLADSAGRDCAFNQPVCWPQNGSLADEQLNNKFRVGGGTGLKLDSYATQSLGFQASRLSLKSCPTDLTAYHL